MEAYHCYQLNTKFYVVSFPLAEVRTQTRWFWNHRGCWCNRSATDQMFCICEILEKNGSTVRQHLSYSYTLRKPMIHLGGKCCAVFPLGLGCAISTGYVMVCKIWFHYLSSLWIHMWVWCETTWNRSIRKSYKYWWNKILHFWMCQSAELCHLEQWASERTFRIGLVIKWMCDVHWYVNESVAHFSVISSQVIHSYTCWKVILFCSSAITRTILFFIWIAHRFI
jgi:hypothetical protein